MDLIQLTEEIILSLVEDKEIIVIPTKTVPQGITAIINFVPDASAMDNEAAMLDAITTSLSTKMQPSSSRTVNSLS